VDASGQRPPTASSEPSRPGRREKGEQRQQREKQEQRVPFTATTTTMSPLMEELRLRLAQRAARTQSNSSATGQAAPDNERYTTCLLAGARAALPTR